MTKEEIILMRKKAFLSQKRLSFMAGISRYRYCDFECGYIELNESEQLQILSVLKSQLEKRKTLIEVYNEEF